MAAMTATEGELLRVPLRKRRAVAGGDELRARRVALERERVRRRAQETDEGDQADDLEDQEDDQEDDLGALVFSESPLGVGYGTHYAEIYMGIPAQRASVIVDTGSHLTALPCSTCSGCGEHTDPLFDVSKSTTAKYLTCSAFESCNSCEQDRCHISQSYTEGSMWDAVVVDELVWVGGFGGENADVILQHYGVRFPLGCQTKETGLFVTQKENGIMGMGRHSATVMAHLLSAGRVTHDVFSLCFDRDGGEMVLGGVDYSHHTTDVAYTPLLASKSSFYPVRVKDVLVGGKSIGAAESELNSGKGVIVDSGTTDTFFVSSASRGFLSAFQDASGGVKYSENKMLLTADEVFSLPTLTVVLAAMDNESGDVELQIPATKYLTPSDNGKFYYGNFHFSERSGGVLGASSMVGLDVIFDSENQRIGFAESGCGEGASTWQNRTIAGESDSDGDSALGNTSSTTSGTITAVFDASSPDGTIARRSSPSAGVFIAEVLVITLVGVVVGVVFWARRQRRNRFWAAIPELDSSRGARSDEDPISTSAAGSPGSNTGRRRDNEGEELPRVAARALSPPLSTASSRRGPSPRLSIGSDEEDEDDGIEVERTEL